MREYIYSRINMQTAIKKHRLSIWVLFYFFALLTLSNGLKSAFSIICQELEWTKRLWARYHLARYNFPTFSTCDTLAPQKLFSQKNMYADTHTRRGRERENGLLALIESVSGVSAVALKQGNSEKVRKEGICSAAPQTGKSSHNALYSLL